MFNKYVKPVLLFSRSQSKAPSFILIYLLIWLVWHGQFIVHVFAANGRFIDKLDSAATATEHQYIVVLLLTGLFYGMRLLYLYFSSKADEIIEQDQPVEDKIGSDQLFRENKDVVRLVALLDDTKKQLAMAKERETRAKQEKSEAMSKVIAIESELEEVKADLAIMTSLNENLTKKLNQTATA